MSDKESLRKCILFFSYGLLNEQDIYSASSQWIKKYGRTDEGETPSEVAFVESSYSVWRKFSKNRSIEGLGFNVFGKNSPQLGPWKEFRMVSSDEEFLTVLWAKVLSVSESSIAEAMGQSIGTIRSRLSSGLLKLGQSCSKSSLGAL